MYPGVDVAEEVGVLFPLLVAAMPTPESVRVVCRTSRWLGVVLGSRLFAMLTSLPPVVEVFDLCSVLGMTKAGEPSLARPELSRLAGRMTLDPLTYPTPVRCLRGVCETRSGPSNKPIDARSERPSCGEVAILICLSSRCGGVVLALARRTALPGCLRLPGFWQLVPAL